MSLESITSVWKDFRNRLRWFTPVGNADNLLKEQNSDVRESKRYRNYSRSLKTYSYYKRIQISLRVLLYAGIIASVAAALGLPELTLIQNIASYIGFSLLIILYLVFTYLSIRAKEEFYLRREMLLCDIQGS